MIVHHSTPTPSKAIRTAAPFRWESRNAPPVAAANRSRLHAPEGLRSIGAAPSSTLRADSKDRPVAAAALPTRSFTLDVALAGLTRIRYSRPGTSGSAGSNRTERTVVLPQPITVPAAFRQADVASTRASPTARMTTFDLSTPRTGSSNRTTAGSVNAAGASIDATGASMSVTNRAVTVRFPFIATVHVVPAPAQSPLHPLKYAPSSGLAASVICPPGSMLRAQVVRQP